MVNAKYYRRYYRKHRKHLLAVHKRYDRRRVLRKKKRILEVFQDLRESVKGIDRNPISNKLNLACIIAEVHTMRMLIPHLGTYFKPQSFINDCLTGHLAKADKLCQEAISYYKKH